MSNLQEFQRLANNRPGELKQAKGKGKKVIEFIGQHVPEEMIYAAGAEPYIMLKGGEADPPDAVLEEMLRFMNPFARAIAGYIMMGLDPVNPFTDIIIAQQAENQIGRISELLEFHGQTLFKVGVPAECEKKFAQDYYLRSLQKLKAKLEEITGTKITDAALKAELEKSNMINSLLRKFDDLRKEDIPKISGYDFIRLCHYSMKTKPDVAIEYLEKIYSEVSKLDGIKTDGPRILLAGHIIAAGDYVVPKLIEETGAKIVADMFDEGLRWYKWDVPTEGDLLNNIMQTRYIKKTPFSVFQPSWKRRFADMKAIIDEYKIDAIVWYQLAFDEIYDMEHTILAKWLGEINVPILKLQSSYEYSREAMGPLQTRIESFVEAVKEGI